MALWRLRTHGAVTVAKDEHKQTGRTHGTCRRGTCSRRCQQPVPGAAGAQASGMGRGRGGPQPRVTEPGVGVRVPVWVCVGMSGSVCESAGVEL